MHAARDEAGGVSPLCAMVKCRIQMRSEVLQLVTSSTATDGTSVAGCCSLLTFVACGSTNTLLALGLSCLRITRIRLVGYTPRCGMSYARALRTLVRTTTHCNVSQHIGVHDTSINRTLSRNFAVHNSDGDSQTSPVLLDLLLRVAHWQEDPPRAALRKRFSFRDARTAARFVLQGV